MKLLADKTRVIAPNAQFPYGQIQDDTPGLSDGTPVDRELYSDIHQFFSRLFALSGLTANGVEDDATNGFQLYQAFEIILQNGLDLQQTLSEKGQANGYAPLDGGALIPAIHLPSFVDDVLEFANQAAFPITGETGKIYVALDTNETFRWSGTTYVEIAAGEVESVFGRQGNVTAQAGDYSAAQITFTPYESITATNLQAAIQQIEDILNGIIPLTQDEKNALAGTSGVPSNTNRYVTSADGRIPSQAENDALAGTNGSPSNTNRFVTSSDGRIPTQAENDALAGSNGTPSNSNRFVTNSDSRMTDARTPSGAAGGDLSGTYPNPSLAISIPTTKRQYKATGVNPTQNGLFWTIDMGDNDYVSVNTAESAIDVTNINRTGVQAGQIVTISFQTDATIFQRGNILIQGPTNDDMVRCNFGTCVFIFNGTQYLLLSNNRDGINII